MSIKITSNDGNGHIKGNSIFQYSYSEDVTPLEPSSSAGGTSQVSFSAIAITEENSDVLHHNSKLIINNNVTLSDSLRGDIQFQVKKASLNAGIVNVVGDTIQWRLNVTKTMNPVGGTGASILSAINYYCGEVGIVPVFDDSFDTELDAISVNFIGWTGNVWEHLKMLCAAVSASTTDNVGIEMYVADGDLHFRKAKQVEYNFKRFETDSSISVDTFDAAESIDIENYNTSYGTNKVIYDINNYAENLNKTDAFKSSISETIQVNAGETVVKRYTVDASLVSVNQPVCVETITRTPPSPYSGTTGEYVIVGTDDLPIKPAQWNDLGGKVLIATTENPNEIEITVTAPQADQIEKANGSGNGLAPYKIGVEATGDYDYPAFWITGTGVFYNKKTEKFLTGASQLYTSRESAASIDNPFITNKRDASSRGVAAAQVACGPNISLNQSLANDGQFGTTIGATQLLSDNRYRVISASYTESAVSLNAIPATSFSDFDIAWSDDTFTNFTETALDPATNPTTALKFNEFTVVPLMDVHVA